MVAIARDLMGDFPSLRRFTTKLGVFYAEGKGAIKLRPDIFKDPIIAAKVLAHEIGHLVDYLPDLSMKRGNILGSIGTMNRYLKGYLSLDPAKDAHPITDKEKTALRQKAKESIKGKAPADLTPADILAIWNSVEVKNKDLESYIAKLDAAQKKEILVAAIKGVIPEWVSFKPVSEDWKEIYERLLREEIIRRKILEKKVIMGELKTLTHTWKPFDKNKVPEDYRKYRYSARELYADALSVLLNKPEMLETIAPQFHAGFFSWLDKKPEVKKSFFDAWELVNNGADAVGARRHNTIKDMFNRGEDQFKIKLAEKKKKNEDFLFRIKYDFIDKNQRTIDLVDKAVKEGKTIADDANPKYMLEEHNYLGGKVKAWVEKNIQPIYKDLQTNNVPWEDLGETLFLERVLNERGELANPLGFNPKTAYDQLDYLKKQYGSRWEIIDRNLSKFKETIKSVIPLLEKSGLYTPDLIKQMKANPAYATYQVIDYMDSYLAASIKHQVGTLKEITNPAGSTVMKTISMIRAAEFNITKRGVLDFVRQNNPEGIKDAKTKWNGKRHEPIESKDPDEALVTYMEDGKLKGVYVDPYIAKSIVRDDVGHTNAILSTIKFFNSKQYRPLFITFNTGFQMFNLVRDFLRFYKNIPGMSIARAVKRYAQGLRPAFRRGFGLTDELITEMEEKKYLSITMSDMVGGLTDEEKQIDYVLQKVGLATPMIKKQWYKKIFEPVLDFVSHMGASFEYIPKVAGYIELKDKIPEHELGSFIRTAVGSPAFLRKSASYSWSNEVFLFSNAIKEGIRTDYMIATNPKTRAGWWWKTAKVTFLPKILMWMAAMGLFGAGVKKIMDMQSEYDKTNYTIVPLGIEKNKGIALRVPQDETGRFLGGTLWKVLRLITDKQPPKFSDAADLLSFWGGQIPNPSPIIQLMLATSQFVTGQNPYDIYRNRTVIPETEYKAGGLPALKIFAMWAFQITGGSIFMNGFIGEKKDNIGTVEQFLRMPVISNIIGRWIKISNYGITESNREITREIASGKAKETIERRQKINDAVKEYRSGDQGIFRRAAIERKLVEAVVGKITDSDKKRSQTLIIKQFRAAIIKGEADPYVNSVIGATSNDEKIAVLKEAKGTLTEKEYQDLENTLSKEGLISKEVIFKVKQ